MKLKKKKIERQNELNFVSSKFAAVGLPAESRDLSYAELNWLLISKRDGICTVNKSVCINNTFYLLILTSFAVYMEAVSVTWLCAP